MKGKLYYMGVGLLLSLVSCSSDTGPEPFYTVGEADNPIRLSVGVGGSLHQATTRSTTYSALSKGTAITLRVDGKWTNKSPEGITQITTAKAADPGSSAYNALSLNPAIYWDDYGTADPANSDSREAGLTVYGVAVDGETSAPSIENNSWTSYSWPLNTNGSEVLKKDLLVGKLSPMKFDERNTNPEKHRLELKHVLSKVTIKLTAGNGFDGNKFTNMPTVTLSGKKGDNSGYDYAKTTGQVNLETGVATPNNAVESLAAQVDFDDNTHNIASAIALLYPTSLIAGNSDEDVVAKLEVDDNVYYIKAAKLRAAINNTANHTENGTVGDTKVYHTLPGFHYILNVVVDKSGLASISATIADWETVTASEDHPLVHVSDPIVSGSDMKGNSYMLYYSEHKESDFSSTLSKEVKKDGESWQLQAPIYWPNHLTHYFFRGIMALASENESVAITESTAGNPVALQMTGGNPYVEVQNAKYEQYKYPSNLLMGKPITRNQMCGSIDHTPVNMEEKGICARTTPIGLTFQYMMSQVEVILKTSADGQPDQVYLNDNTKVEIVNGYNSGKIYLGTMSVEGKDKQDYKLENVDTDNLKRHSIIVPQALDDIQFKVTVYKKDSSPLAIDDVYYLKIKDTKKTDDSLVAPNGKWESGKHYVYTLNILKSGISAVATLQDWTKVVSGDEEIWL